ncbi:MAG: glycosyltransferase family 1 protein [Patescibacteria group bacterium]
MKLLLDARRINAKFLGGVGIYVDQLVHYFIKNKNECFLLILENEELPQFYTHNPLITLIPFGKTYANCKERFILEKNELPSIIEKIKPDVFHALDNTGAAQKISAKNIVTIHDLIPLVLGEYMSSIDQKEYSAAIKATAKNADIIISISEFTKKEIVKRLNVPTEKIKVIYNGYNLGKILSVSNFKHLCSHLKISKNYIIYVGGLGPRKNITRLIKSFAIVKQKIKQNIQLILTGKIKKNIKKEIAEYRKTIKLLNLDKDVIFTDYISQSELDSLRKNAAMAVYPSLYEGFGLPVIEAMALKTPVIASNISSIPEIANDAAIFINPKSIKEIAAAIIKLLSDANLRQRLKEKGLKNIKRFSWKKTARETWKLYKSLL